MQKRERERYGAVRGMTEAAADDDDIKGIIIMLLNMIHIIFFRSFIFFSFRFVLSLVRSFEIFNPGLYLFLD